MYRLSDQQIDYILNDIGARGVEMEDLQQNLLDHICCIIEQNLEEDGNFEDFYASTVRTFYKHELWEIEEETIRVLTFKNYYTMKKAMIVSGIFSVATFITGSLFKIMHWPGASPFLLLGIMSMAFIFLPLMFLFRTRESGPKRNKPVAFVATLVGILACLCVLFSIMHWPGRTVIWILTSAVSMFVLIPVYFFTGIRQPETRVNTIITTIILVGATCLQFTMIALKPIPRLEAAGYVSGRELEGTYRYVTEQTGLWLKTDATGPEAKALAEKSDALCSAIEQIKVSLVNAVESRHDQAVDYSRLSNELFSNYDLPTVSLFGRERNSTLMPGLRKDLDAFNAFVSVHYRRPAFGMLNTAARKGISDDMQLVSWEHSYFYEVPFGMVLRNLVQLQLDIRIAEAACLKL